MLHQVNPYIPIYRIACEQLHINFNIDIVLTSQIQLIIENYADRRQYNLPTIEEVAVIIIGKSDQLSQQDI